MRIAEVNLKQTNNVGDQLASPTRYFDFPTATIDYVHPDSENLADYDLLIIGGGDILPRLKLLERCEQLPKKTRVVIWGAGCGDRRPGFKEKWLERWASISDIFAPREALVGECCPCPSCLDPVFDERPFTATGLGVGIYSNKKTRPLARDDGSLLGAHNEQPVEEVVSFLRSHEEIISSSFHGGYWAALLNKPVVTVAFNRKFYDQPYNVIVTQSLEEATSKLDEASSLNNAGLLRLARERNRKVAIEVQRLIERS
ncbi:MAG: polysaccharide pyruvyl transferase family protein [Planctomycetota bacterium]